MRKTPLLILFMLFLATFAEANTYWVSKSGTDGQCTNSSIAQTTGAELTVNAAINCVIKAGGAPHTINVRTGTYNEVIERNDLPSGTSNTNRIFLTAIDGAHTVVLNGKAGDAIIRMWPNNGGPYYQYWEVNGIDIDAANTQGVGIEGGVFINYKNMDIRNMAKNVCPSGQICGPGHAITVAFGGNGIGVSDGSHDNVFTNISIHDTTFSVVDQGGGNCCQGPHGMYIQGNDNVFDGMVIYRVGQHGFQFYSHTNIAFVHGNVIKNSIIHDTGMSASVSGSTFAGGASCASIDGVSTGSSINIIQNSVCYNSADGITVGGTGHVIFNNTISGVTGSAIYVGGGSGHIVRNNLAVGGNQKFPNDASATIDHNVCDVAGANCAVVGNISFLNASTHDFHLVGNAATNVAIDAGTTQISGSTAGACSSSNVGSLSIVISNTSFSGKCPDAGAFESGGPSNTPPSINLTSPVAGTGTIAVSSNSPTINLVGTSSDIDGTVSKVTWSCNTCTVSGSSSGTVGGTVSNWTISNVALASGLNVMTVTATDDQGAATALTLNITYTAPVGVTNTIQVRANGPDAPIVLLSFNEGSGTTVGDSSGQVIPNNAQFTGTGNTWVAGKAGFGTAVNFNGSGGLQIPYSDSLNISIFTIEAWVFANSSFADYRALFATDPSLGSYLFLFSNTASGLCGGSAGVPGGGFGDAATPTGYDAACDTIGLPLNTWTHVAVTYDGANLIFYRNGVPTMTTPTTYLPLENSGPRYVATSSFGEGFNGSLDDFRIYNRNRSQAQIQNDMITPIGAAGAVVSAVTYGADANVTYGSNASVTVGQ